MRRSVLVVLLSIALFVGAAVAPPAAAWVQCSPPAACSPSPCDPGCTICLFFDDETGAFQGYIMYNC